MTTTIDQAFVTQFEREVHMAYQRMGSMARGTIRTKAGVTGSTARFQKAGKGTTTTKARHSDITPMNADRTYVDVTLEDHYAGEYVDALDELKIQHDERGVIANTIAGALGRKTDDIIFTAMDATTNARNVGTAATYSSVGSWIAFMEGMGIDDVPMDDGRYAVVCWQAWGDLMALDAFNRQEYVPGDTLWVNGVTAKKWLSFNWYPHAGLPVDGSNDTKCFFYHRTAVGHAIAADVSMDVTWQGTKQAHFMVGKMSMGAVLIDSTGVIELLYDT